MDARAILVLRLKELSLACVWAFQSLEQCFSSCHVHMKGNVGKMLILVQLSGVRPEMLHF